VKRGEQAGPSDDHGRRAVTEDESGDADTNAQLRAMRSVWLSMRDEDPPDGGLVDLLAAARAKAATMRARPTLRQRMLAMLRRPPALAFATVVVLVGGAVLVVARGSGVRSSDLAAGSSGMVEAGRQSEVAAHEPGVAAGTTSARAAPDEQVRSNELDQRPVGGGATAATTGKPERTAAPMEASGALGTAERVKAVDAPRAPGSRPTGELAAVSDEEPAGARPAPSETGAVATRPSPPEVAVAAPHQPESLENTPTERRPARLDRLYKQCSSAARRGDCVVVRRLVAQIKLQDRGYRGRIARDAAVEKCLASEAPQASQASE
jgi:hypothetical protein